MALHLTTDHSTLCPTPLHRQHDPAECAVPCSRRSCTPTTGRPPSAAPPGPRHSPRTPPIPAPQPWGACPASPRPSVSTAPVIRCTAPTHANTRGAARGRGERREGLQTTCGASAWRRDDGGREGGEAAKHVVCMSSGTLRPPRRLPPPNVNGSGHLPSPICLSHSYFPDQFPAAEPPAARRQPASP